MKDILQAPIRLFSTKLWAFVVVMLVSGGLLSTTKELGLAFAEAMGGLKPLDVQNGLTAEVILEQTRLYTAEAREIYGRFLLYDALAWFVLPFYLGAVVAYAVRYVSATFYKRLWGWGAFLSVYVLGLVNWVENGLIYALVFNGRGELAEAVRMAAQMRIAVILVAFTPAGLAVIWFLFVSAGRESTAVRKDR